MATRLAARKSYNPKNKGKKSYQPILTFIAETREYVWGELRNGDRHAGRVGISYSDQYQEKGLFQRLMDRLREITTGPTGFLPVLATPLSE
jgi:hypothetical protein